MIAFHHGLGYLHRLHFPPFPHLHETIIHVGSSILVLF